MEPRVVAVAAQLVIVLALAVCHCACGEAGAGTADGAAGKGGDLTGFAVVELFTSEGCSSCPPADALLEEVAGEARKDGRAVYPLSFHVDYWDRLGWRDPYSDPAHSRRQSAYARLFHTAGSYTPQAVVNGKVEFIGSDQARMTLEIDRALRDVRSVEVRLNMARRGGSDAFEVRYSASPAPAGAVINVCMVQRRATSEVRRGENAGRSLRHTNVVREMKTEAIAGDGTGRVELTLPGGVEVGNAEVIAFIQEERTMRIVGAAAAPLPVAPPTPE